MLDRAGIKPGSSYSSNHLTMGNLSRCFAFSSIPSNTYKYDTATTAHLKHQGTKEQLLAHEKGTNTVRDSNPTHFTVWLETISHRWKLVFLQYFTFFVENSERRSKWNLSFMKWTGTHRAGERQRERTVEERGNAVSRNGGEKFVARKNGALIFF